MRGLLLVSLAVIAGCSEYDLTDDNFVNGGPGPDIKVEPAVLSWGVRLPGCPDDPKTVTVTNVGEGPLEVSRIRLQGDGSGAYSISGTADVVNGAGDTSLEPGDSFTFEVEFLAQTFIDYAAEIEIRSNDRDEETVGVDLEGEGGNNPTNEDVFSQDTPDAVDVLWVLDNSCSMSGVLDDLNGAMDSFIANFVTLGLNYRMAVTTTDMDGVAPNVRPGQNGTLVGTNPIMDSQTMSNAEVIAAFDAVVTEVTGPGAIGSGNERALEAAHAALQSPGHAVDGLVRTDSNLAIIVVGDEDDGSSNNAGFYSSWIDTYKTDPDRTSVSGLVPMGGGDFEDMFDPNGCIDSFGAPKINGVIDNTGGVRSPLCRLSDPAAFEPIMQYLSFTAAGLAVIFELSGEPATGYAGMSVTVDGVAVNFDVLGVNGWTYNHETNSVVFAGSAIPGPGAEIVVTYPVAGTCMQ